MVDPLSTDARSRLMARVGSRDTLPELKVRSLLHRLGYRFRLHRKTLPGTPDIVLPSRGVVVFVHGCFWHAHSCRKGTLPKSRVEFWVLKIGKNQKRDRRNRRELQALGWRVVAVWECELRNMERLERKLLRIIG